MREWRANLSAALYVLALAVSAFGTLWLIYTHMGLWARGKFAIGSFSGIVVAEYVFGSLVLWLPARIIQRRMRWDLVFYGLCAVPILMLVLIPAKFYVD
jgi:hypothetical protein